MAYKEIVKYSLTYQSGPHLFVQLAGETFMRLFPIGTNDGVYVGDLLRNEKPMFCDYERKILSTGNEDVGEEES